LRENQDDLHKKGLHSVEAHETRDFLVADNEEEEAKECDE
jgi:hypothetical protein